jgi:TPR repeat protein
MTQKLFPLLAIVFCALLAGRAEARTSAEISASFNAGVAAYDAGDYQTAFKTWWELRYEDLAAMRNLAMMLRKGQGVPKDPQKAEELYLRAAEAGLPTAQADLADMYLKGELGSPDLTRALPLLQAAAAANHPLAQYQLGQFYETGAPPLVPQNLEVARQLYAAAASHGMPEAAARAAFLGPPQVQAQGTQQAGAQAPSQASSQTQPSATLRGPAP